MVAMKAKLFSLDYWPSKTGRDYADENGNPPPNVMVDSYGKYIQNEFGEYAVYIPSRLEVVLEGENAVLYYFDILPDLKRYDPKFRATKKRRLEIEAFLKNWEGFGIDLETSQPTGLYTAIAAYMMGRKPSNEEGAC